MIDFKNHLLGGGGKSKILLTFLSLIVCLLLGNCTSKNSGSNAGLALVGLAGGGSSSGGGVMTQASNGTATIDLTKAFKGLDDVIGVKSSNKLSTAGNRILSLSGNDVLAAVNSKTWTRLKNAGQIQITKADTLLFAIVPKEGTITDVIEIGSYVGTGRNDEIGFGAKDTGGITLNSSFDQYGVTAVALIAKDDSAKSSTAFKALKDASLDILKAKNADAVTSGINKISLNALKTKAKAAADNSKIKAAKEKAKPTQGTSASSKITSASYNVVNDVLTLKGTGLCPSDLAGCIVKSDLAKIYFRRKFDSTSIGGQESGKLTEH